MLKLEKKEMFYKKITSYPILIILLVIFLISKKNFFSQKPSISFEHVFFEQRIRFSKKISLRRKELKKKLNYSNYFFEGASELYFTRNIKKIIFELQKSKNLGLLLLRTLKKFCRKRKNSYIKKSKKLFKKNLKFLPLQLDYFKKLFFRKRKKKLKKKDYIIKLNKCRRVLKKYFIRSQKKKKFKVLASPLLQTFSNALYVF